LTGVLRWILPLLLGVLAGCEDSSDPIVIPPGALIQYQTTNFLYYSDDRYAVFLREPTAENGTLETVLDLTPEGEELLDGEMVHRVISPKDVTLEGPYILQVNMEYHSLVLYDFIYDPEIVATPGLLSTLVYQSLANFPDKPISTYSASDIVTLKDFVADFAAERMSQFQLTFEMAPNLVFNFLKNGLEANKEYLDLLASMGAQYNYDDTPTLLSAPFPFAVPNNPPTLDEGGSTPPGLIVGKEQVTLEVGAQAQDIDGDLLFFLWTRDGKTVLADSQLYEWTPNSQEGGGDPYDLQVFVTDGGQVLNVTWEIMIQDFNRKPEITGVCSPTIEEKSAWTCEFTGTDPDDDPVQWSLSNLGTTAVPTINGQEAPAVVSGNSITLEWTPNNDDAKRGSGLMELRLDDGKNGFEIRNLSVLVTDINSPPILQGNGIVPTNYNDPREWDNCLDADPLGQGVFSFDIVVIDPDNVDPTTNPKDQISANVAGSLLPALTELPSEVFPDRTVFHYEWRPQHNAKSGNLVILMQDDHGGNVAPITINLNADDMNQVPCRQNGLNRTMSLSGINPVRNQTLLFQDGDGDATLIRSRNINWEVFHHLQSCDSSFEPLSAVRSQGSSDFLYETQHSFNSQCLRSYEEAPYSGSVIFERNTGFENSISIPAGTAAWVDEGATGTRAEFQTVKTVTLGSGISGVAVPVVAINRTAPVGSLSILENPGILEDGSIGVSNPTSLTNAVESVTFSRPGPFANDIVIPSGLIATTNILLNSATPTLRYEVIEDVVFPAADTSVPNVAVRRLLLEVPQNQVSRTVAGLESQGVSVTNPSEAFGQNGSYPYDYKARYLTSENARFCFPAEGYDGGGVAANMLTILEGPMATQLSLIQNDPLQMSGDVILQRSSAAGSLVLSPGDYRFSSANLTGYNLNETVTFGPGETSKTVTLVRESVRHPGTNQWYYNVCVQFIDRNYPPIFTSASTGFVNEGEELLGFPIAVTDNISQPLLANDIDDRYNFTFSNVGTVPIGDVLLCREPAADPATFADNCTPCNDSTSLTHHQSRKCHLRFRPDPLDVAQTFQFSIQVDDNGATYPTNTNIRNQTVSISVREFNNAPVFSDGTWSPYPSGVGDSETTSLESGTFIENSESSFPVYAEDVDKTTDFKQLGFSVEPDVFDIKNNVWVPAPEGMTAGVTAFTGNPGGLGGKTEGFVKWTPKDYDVKRLSTNEGFVVKLRVFDSLSNSATRLDDFVFLKFRVRNLNNAPEIEPIGVQANSFEISADVYFSVDFEVSDSDNHLGTDLSLCLDRNGAPARHPTLDGPTPLADCHATTAHWPDELTTYDPTYNGNRNVGASECRTGGDESGLNEDLAIPKLTRINGPTLEGEKVKYTYRLEWCPQKSHLGSFAANLLLTDNGDTAANGDSKSPLSGSGPLFFNVKAPVFFESPKLDNSGLPDHFMPQTAAGLSLSPFVYPTLVNNSNKNPLAYEIVFGPGDCENDGMCIDGEGVLTWTPPVEAITDPLDPTTWHRVEIRVTDTVTLDDDTVHFFLQVHSPLGPPVEQPPNIDSFLPAITNISTKERDVTTFSVTASDVNSNDTLFYRWYVDDILVSDSGSTFSYRPDTTQGSVDADGTGPLNPGQHKIRVEVDDGNSADSVEWTVNIKNTFLVSNKIFDVESARDGVSLSDIKWFSETSLNTEISGSQISYLLFSGSYTVGPTIRNYAWQLQFINSQLQTDWNYYEDLSWPSGATTTNVAYQMLSETTFRFLLTSSTNRYGPYNSTTNSVRLQGDLGTLPIPLKSGQLCSGSCPRYHFLGEGRYGSRVGDKYLKGGNYFLFAGDDRKTLQWDQNATGGTTFWNLTSISPDSKVMDMKIDPDLEHLYVTTQDPLTQNYRLLVFDLGPLASSNSPTLLSNLDMYDGNLANRDSRPSSIAIDYAQHHVYVFLSGVGGLAKLEDVSGAPGPGQLSYVGTDEIEASLGDAAASGQRLVWDGTSQLLYGISREGRQLFTLDPSDGDQVSTTSTVQKLDSIQVLPNTNLILLIDRSGSQVFQAK